MAGLTISRDLFFSKFYDFAMECADNTMAGVVKKNGAINKRIDQALVKSVAVYYALEKVFQNYDVDRATEKGIKGFIFTTVHNQTLTELGKAGTEIKPLTQDVGTLFKNPAAMGYTRDLSYKQRKEEVLAGMMAKLKTLSPEDQELIGFWMDDRKTYIERAIEVLGLEDTPGNRNMIAVRFNRAKIHLAKAMGGKKPNYRDSYAQFPSASNALPAQFAPAQLNTKSLRQQKVAAEITKSLDYQYMSERLYDMLVK